MRHRAPNSYPQEMNTQKRVNKLSAAIQLSLLSSWLVLLFGGASQFITSPAGAVAKYCDEYVCLWVCQSVCLSVCEDISGTTRAIFTNF